MTILDLHSQIQERFKTVKQHIEDITGSGGRKPDLVTVVGVSKRHSAETIVAAVTGGLRNIGENKVQEAVEKKAIVDGLLEGQGISPGEICWHMVGHLQRNKVNKAVEIFDVIQSIDSRKLAVKVSSAALNRGKAISIFVEVNMAGEVSKSGLPASEVEDFVAEVLTLEGIRVKGLMSIGPHVRDRNVILNCFKDTKLLFDAVRNKMPEEERGEFQLSMGMSGDYDLAIQAGSSMVRIGTAIFGARPS